MISSGRGELAIFNARFDSDTTVRDANGYDQIFAPTIKMNKNVRVPVEEADESLVLGSTLYSEASFRY